MNVNFVRYARPCQHHGNIIVNINFYSTSSETGYEIFDEYEPVDNMEIQLWTWTLWNIYKPVDNRHLNHNSWECELANETHVFEPVNARVTGNTVVNMNFVKCVRVSRQHGHTVVNMNFVKCVRVSRQHGHTVVNMNFVKCVRVSRQHGHTVVNMNFVKCVRVSRQRGHTVVNMNFVKCVRISRQGNFSCENELCEIFISRSTTDI